MNKMGKIKKILENKFIQMIFRDFTTFGGIVFFAFVIAIAFLSREYNLFFKLLFGFVFTAVITVVIRLVYFKNRPAKQEYSNIIEKIDASSFPSLHTARVVFISLTFVNVVNNKFLGAFLLLMAAIVAYSRVYLKKHDLLDLAGGLILGVITYWLALMIVF